MVRISPEYTFFTNLQVSDIHVSRSCEANKWGVSNGPADRLHVGHFSFWNTHPVTIPMLAACSITDNVNVGGRITVKVRIVCDCEM
jgi:hypothetical protein